MTACLHNCLRLALLLGASAVAAGGCSGVRSPDVGPIRVSTMSSDVCIGDTRYAQKFAQEFKNNSWQMNNGGHWSMQYPWGHTNPGAHDAAYYVDSDQGTGLDPFSIVNGNTLAITARPASAEMQPQIDGRVFVSGVISTGGVAGAPGAAGPPAFSQRYGYYEVRAQLPKGQGVWPAFWMLDSEGARAEIDVFELLGNDSSTIYQSVHHPDGTGDSYPYHVSFDPTAGFHRYGVLVMPDKDTYFIDGSATHEIADASQGSFYFMISLQVGEPDSWPGAPNATTSWPAHLYVQYFRAYIPTAGSC